jgi:hypothetical protein
MTDTNGARSATVQALTAEVRVLMVGSRQVTMSVAKQLDVIPLHQLEMFGRVKLSDDDTWVIGADRETGVLSRACAEHTIPWSPVIDIVDDPNRRKPLRCRVRQPNTHYDSGLVDLSWPIGDRYRPIRLLADDMEDRHGSRYLCQEKGCSCSSEHCTTDCMSWNPRDYFHDIKHQVRAHVAAYTAERALIDDARAQPLIVLAGLR